MDRTVTFDLASAFRSLRRSPGFTGTAILILGLGIGSAAAMFTVARAVLLRPLPVRDQDRIVIPRTIDARGTDVPMSVDVMADLEEFRRESRTMQAIAGEAHQGAFTTALLDGDRTLTLKAGWVTGNFFDVLGAEPVLGRFFTAEDEVCFCRRASRRETSVIVLSHETWRRQFGGDSAVLGRQLANPYTLRRYTIVGVAPAGLAYPVGAEYWNPIVYGSGLNLLGRLAPGATPATAREEFLTLTKRLAKYPEFSKLIAGSEVQTITQAVLGDVQPAFRLLLAAVALLLVIACVNVGHLLLLRTVSRAHEIAVRRSLGARSGDIVGQLIAESAVLAVAGGAAGLTLAWALLGSLTVLSPAGIPRMDVVRVEADPLVAAVVLTLLSMLVIVAVPAFATIREGLGTTLRSDARSGRSARGRRTRRWLVASQVALAVVMLAGAGLLVRSLEKLQGVKLGYRPEYLSLLSVVTPVTLGDMDNQFLDMLDRVSPALRALPGVTALTPMVVSPFLGPQVFTGPWEGEGQDPVEPGKNPMIPIEAGGPEYFRTLGIPLVRGRGFLESDRETSSRVAVLSESAARLLFGENDPIGSRIRNAGDTSANAWRTVVGIAGDIRFRRLREANPTVYLVSRQYFFQGLIAVRTTASIDGQVPVMQRAVHDAFPGARIVRVERMDQLLAGQRALPRFSTLLLSGFGLAALLLAAIGLHGVIALAVKERTRELGVRTVLGATPGQLRRDVLGWALALAGTGGVVGLAVAVSTSHLLGSLLFEVSPVDPIALAGASIVLMTVTLLAAYVPARKATLVDPAIVLRGE